MNTTRPVAAAILTGGRARRLGGRRKATLDVGGIPIIRRQLAALRQIADPIILVGDDPGPCGEPGVEIVPDALPGCGALGGIYTAISASPHERTLVVACDMPFLSVPLFQHMLAVRGADLVIPRSSRGYEPLCALYSRACAAPIRVRLGRGELEASVLPAGVRIVDIGPEALAAFDSHGLLFVNVNTPHDYERARNLAQAQSKESEDRIMNGPRH